MKTSVKVLLGAFILTMSAGASAANILKENVTIAGLYNVPTGGFLIISTPGGIDPVCGPSGNLVYVQPNQNQVNADGAKAALAIALTALTLNKTINIYYDNTQGAPCYASIVWIQP